MPGVAGRLLDSESDSVRNASTESARYSVIRGSHVRRRRMTCMQRGRGCTEECTRFASFQGFGYLVFLLAKGEGVVPVQNNFADATTERVLSAVSGKSTGACLQICPAEVKRKKGSMRGTSVNWRHASDDKFNSPSFSAVGYASYERRSVGARSLAEVQSSGLWVRTS